MTGKGKVRREAVTVQAALRATMSPLMRQIRKFSALSVCLDVLPEEIKGMAAPFDVRLAPSRGLPQTKKAPAGGADVNTLYLYVASPTVETVLEQRKAALIKQINARLPVAVVEEFRYDIVPQQKIDRQLNILELTPD